MDSSTESVTIHFDGICTHFRGVVPGVPHRVVLPDAHDARTGTIQVGDNVPVTYTIPPHKGKLMSGNDPVDITVGSLIVGGVLEQGVRLQIENPVPGQSLSYPADADYNQMPALTAFLSAYHPSDDIVLGGRAICYFDFFEGKVTTTTEEPGGPTHTSITVQTNGAPRLQVRPLIGDPSVATVSASSFEVPVVVSIENFCVQGGEYDFLLNYLTAEGGIPPKVDAAFPTEPAPDQAEGTSAACSDSRYP
jgi:hypothetical protein